MNTLYRNKGKRKFCIKQVFIFGIIIHICLLIIQTFPLCVEIEKFSITKSLHPRCQGHHIRSNYYWDHFFLIIYKNSKLQMINDFFRNINYFKKYFQSLFDGYQIWYVKAMVKNNFLIIF